MSIISRRDFLAQVAAAGAATFLGRSVLAGEGAHTAKRGTDMVTLGRSGLKTTVLGIGTGTVGGSQQRGIGQAEFTKLVRHALDRGIHYVDTADMYHTHGMVSTALEGVPRDKYFIQTKTTAKQAEKAKADIERFRQELKIETIDSLLMHCMTKGSWPADMRPVMDVLQEAKQKGQVRAFGISCHGYEPLVASVDTDWPDIQLARINPFQMAMDSTPEKVAAQLKKMHAKGRGVIGMKIYGENGLSSRAQRAESLKYVLGLGCVDCFTIGFVNPRQIDETLELIEQALA